MNRVEFMKRLRELLSDISENEREEALNYYEDYFDDAGIENEERIIESLGSPEKVAKTIKDGLNDGSGDCGEFSENGFHGYGEEEKNEIGKHRKRGFWERIRDLGTGGIILIALLAVFALPILLPLGIAAVGVVAGLLMAVLGVLFAALIAGVAFVILGAALFGTAVLTIAAAPAVSAVVIGISFIVVGLGIMLVILGGWILWRAFPPMIRWFVNICRKPFERKEKAI